MRTGDYSKMNILKWLVYPVGLIMFITCTSKGVGGQADADFSDTIAKREFKLPVIPKELTVPQDRANYLIAHYWGSFDFSDTVYTHLPEITEQAFVNYIEILPHATKSVSYFSIKDMLSKAETCSPVVYTYFLDHYKKYLYDPNSPLRNEEYYIPVLNYVIESDKTRDTERQRAEFDLKLLLKNRVGEKATDIAYTLASGKTERLYDIKGQYTLLCFYNPDCHACEQVTHYMKESELIDRLVKSRILKIVMIYPDKDLDLWKKHQVNIPESWINGYDKRTEINNKQLYDLKATPTLYLLDKDKNVLLKDADIVKMEIYIRDNSPVMLYDKQN